MGNVTPGPVNNGTVSKGTVAPNRADVLAALADPTRRSLYRAIVDAGEPISRDAAAAATGIPRSTAALHLDRLAQAGLVTTKFRRLSGRTGPGSGRPAKLYAAAASDMLASIPERHYELAGGILAAGAERADREGTRVRDAIAREARATGAAIGAANQPLERALETCGYEPVTDADGDIVLDNCPFHALATRHTDLVCTTNLELIRGMAAAAGDARQAVLEPRDRHCCVALRHIAHAGADTNVQQTDA